MKRPLTTRWQYCVRDAMSMTLGPRHRVLEEGGALVGDEEEPILEAARAIRAYLPDLLGDAALEVDRSIADLFSAGAGGAQITQGLARVLTEHTETREWTAQLLSNGKLLPPEISVLIDRGAAPPPGDPGVVSAVRYVCPQGDYVRYRTSVSEQVPSCPTHGATLGRG